ncbi:MAG: hypothetical protein R2851_21370 [Caldilineaceae bacterium]
MRNSDPFSDLIRSIEENLQREGDDWIPRMTNRRVNRAPHKQAADDGGCGF